MNLDDLDPAALGAALSQLPPAHPLVCAARAAAEVADGRADYERAMVEASEDVAREVAGDDLGGRYRDAQTMWRGRAEVDGPDSYAARQASEMEAFVPEPRPPVGAEYDPVTASMVAEAKAWAAAQDAAAEEALHDAMEHHWARQDGHDDEAARWRVR